MVGLEWQQKIRENLSTGVKVIKEVTVISFNLHDYSVRVILEV